MARYIINVTSNGDRLFSTSRSSIGTDKEKLARIVGLFDIIVNGAPDEEGMAMEVVLIGDSIAKTCNLLGTPLDSIPKPMGAVFSEPFGNAAGDTGTDPRIAQVAALKNNGWYEHGNGFITKDGQENRYDTWDECIGGEVGLPLNHPAVAAHSVAQANAESWATLGKKKA